MEEVLAAFVLLAVAIGSCYRCFVGCMRWLCKKKMIVCRGRAERHLPAKSAGAPLEQQLAVVLRREADLNAALGHVRSRVHRLKQKLGRKVEAGPWGSDSSPAEPMVIAGLQNDSVVATVAPALDVNCQTPRDESRLAATRAILLHAAALQAVAAKAAAEAAAAHAAAEEAAVDAALAREAATQIAEEVNTTCKVRGWWHEDSDEAFDWVDPTAAAAPHEGDAWIPLDRWQGLCDAQTAPSEATVFEPLFAASRVPPDAACLPAPPAAFLDGGRPRARPHCRSAVNDGRGICSNAR